MNFFWVKSRIFPRTIWITTITATTRLRMIKGYIMTIMIRLTKTGMTKDARLVGLASPAD
jgi:hypothetical protein